MSDFEDREKLSNLTPQQRLLNLEYLVFRMFVNTTDLPPGPEQSPIVTVDDFHPDAPPAPPEKAVAYDLMYARAGLDQIFHATGGNVSIPHALHAIRASIEKFNKDAKAQLEGEAESEESA